jgi:hypothetical protein
MAIREDKVHALQDAKAALDEAVSTPGGDGTAAMENWLAVAKDSTPEELGVVLPGGKSAT